MYNLTTAKDHDLLPEKNSIKKVLEEIGQKATANDILFIFLSGHGVMEGEGKKLFYYMTADAADFDAYAVAGISTTELTEWIKPQNIKAQKRILILDACHSGAAVAESKGITRAPSNFNLDAIAGTGQLVISSSKSDQVSWESKRYANGVFTAKLMQALEAQGKQTTLDDAFKHLKDGVETEVRFDRMVDQTPVMLDKWTGTKLALAAPPLEPRRVLPELPEPEPTPAPAVRKTPTAASAVQNTERSVPVIPNAARSDSV